MRARNVILFVTAASAGTFLILCSGACNKTPNDNGAAETKVHPITVSPTPTSNLSTIAGPSPTQPGSALPNTAEVAQAMSRVFDKAAHMDETRAPAFFVGDLNGDGSEDIAVAAKVPDESLPEINSDLANWSLEDPREVPIPGTKMAEQLTKPKPIKAAKTDSLLAIIHGVGSQGWRNPAARQTFLLRNAVGTNLLVQPADKAANGSPNSKLPPLRGEVIIETINGRPGMLFWTGAKYAWFPLQ